MPYITHPLGKTFYKVSGKRSKKTPLIFLHGGPGGTLKSTEPLLSLSADRPVYIYDQLGCGKSSVTGPKKWTVNSKGKEVKSLTFRSPMFSAKDWVKDSDLLISKMSNKHKKVIKYCHEIGATDAKVYKEATFAYYLKHVLRNKKILLDSAKKGKNKNLNGKKVYKHMWGETEFFPTGNLKNYNKVQGLKKIKVPSLFMCGEYDESTPRTTKRYSRLPQQGEFKVLKGCSHASLQEKPKLVLKEMKSFLKKHD